MKTATCCFLAFLCIIQNAYAGYGSYSGTGQSTSVLPKKYTITTLVAPPLINAPDEDGNLSGLIVDVLNRFKAGGDFDFVLSLSETELYGDSFPNGTSNGMINEVVTAQKDIAAGALTATHNRTLVVDFTHFLFISIYRVAVNKDYNPATTQYFTYNSTALQSYLQTNTLNPLVKTIWASIQKDPANNIVTSYEDGVQRVANGGNVAFVAATPFVTIEQQKHKDKVFFTEDNLSYVWFAMAMKIDSPLRRILNDKILELSENGGYDIISHKLPTPCLS